MYVAMDSPPPSYTAPRKIRKQRIPKACGECRRSKLRCDAHRPCSRCRISGKACEYVEPRNDAIKIEALEKEVESLRTKLRECSYSFDQTVAATSLDPVVSWPPITFPPFSQPGLLYNTTSFDLPDVFDQNMFAEPLGESIMEANVCTASLPSTPATNDPKWMGYQLEIDDAHALDFITAGILTTEQAEANLHVFFQGCGNYFPFVDPEYDSVQRLRSKSNLLFNTICAVGCRARSGHRSHFWRILDTHVSRMHDNIATTGKPSVETIQALLIRACYSSERSLLISMATRIALELDLPEAYNDLSSKIILGGGQGSLESPERDVLLQKTRTWLSILVLRLMLGIDTGKSLDFNLYGDVRRYRILLDKPFSTELDLCLLEQVELNVLRAKIYKSLTKGMDADDEGLMNAVRDARIDIEVWFNDWTHMLNSQTQVSWLRINLEVQRHWADITTLCWAVHACNGYEYGYGGCTTDDAMSPTQKDILVMAKGALRRHLQAIMAEPRLYIRNLRYATDFVWAKFVFCFLLLLDLSILVSDGGAEEDDRRSRLDLLSRGNALLAELADAGGIITGETCSHMSRDCLRILQDGIDSYARSISGILGNDARMSAAGEMLAFGLSEQTTASSTSGSSSGSSNSRESFVPKQFVFEWKFPYPWLQPSQSEAWQV